MKIFLILVIFLISSNSIARSSLHVDAKSSSSKKIIADKDEHKVGKISTHATENNHKHQHTKKTSTVTQTNLENKTFKVEFMSLKHNKTNSRSGPSKEYPIVTVFTKKNEPLKILNKYEDWYYIEDFDEERGWIHSNLLSSKRFVIIMASEKINMLSNYKNPESVTAYILPKVRCKLHKVQSDWCHVSCSGNKGWINKKYLWGV